MFSTFKRKNVSSTECVDIIQNTVYDYLKPMGFRKYGRTFHRFVEGDISQVIHFQNGCPQKKVKNVLWINIGIRIPECQERCFSLSEPVKKYYHEYDCNMRTRLGFLADGKDTVYDLTGNPKKIASDVIKKLEKYVIPVFCVLNCRENILLYRRRYRSFDQFAYSSIALEEAMIYGRRGDMEKASVLFNEYYQEQLAEYKNDLENGTKFYLNKGERLSYLNMKTGKSEEITANRDGYVITYTANRNHIDYLENLAEQLGIVLK